MLNRIKTIVIAVLAAFLTTYSAYAAGIQLQPAGAIHLDFHKSALVDKNRVTGAFLGGSIELGDGQGSVEGCIEDAYVQSNGNINFDIRCHVTMDDDAAILVNYAGVLIPDEKFWDLLLGGKSVTPNNGVSLWIAEFKMLTTSEAYSWVNDHVFIGHGLEIYGPSEAGPGKVIYDLYKVTY